MRGLSLNSQPLSSAPVSTSGRHALGVVCTSPMSDAVDRFLADAKPASGVGFVPRARSWPIVVLVVDDSDDTELASSLAAVKSVAASDYDGSWSAMVEGTRPIVKFRLIRRDGKWARQWTYRDPDGSVLNAISAGLHHVAIVPLVGDLSEFVCEGLRGAIVVDAQASEPIASAPGFIAEPTSPG
jgi:hypothetical protein